MNEPCTDWLTLDFQCTEKSVTWMGEFADTLHDRTQNIGKLGGSNPTKLPSGYDSHSHGIGGP